MIDFPIPKAQPLNLVGNFLKGSQAIESIRQQALSDKLKKSQLAALPAAQKARLESMLAATELTRARTRALPEQQEQQRRLREAQIAALGQKGQTMGITSSGIPVMLPGGALPGATSGAAPGMQPGLSPGMAPSIAQPGVQPQPAAPTGPDVLPQQAEKNADVFLPSQVGKTRGSVGTWRNPWTGETISALTSEGRNKLQGQYRAMTNMLPSLHALKHSGAVGIGGGPSVIGQDMKQWIGMKGDPEAAAIYSQELKKMREFYPKAVGINSTDKSQDAAEGIFQRPRGLSSKAYGKLMDRSISRFENQAREVKQALLDGGWHISPHEEDIEKKVMSPVSQQDSGMPKFKTKAGALNWFREQPREVQMKIKSLNYG